jgi:hypothetical protein
VTAAFAAPAEAATARAAAGGRLTRGSLPHGGTDGRVNTAG